MFPLKDLSFAGEATFKYLGSLLRSWLFKWLDTLILVDCICLDNNTVQSNNSDDFQLHALHLDLGYDIVHDIIDMTDKVRYDFTS